MSTRSPAISIRLLTAMLAVAVVLGMAAPAVAAEAAVRLSPAVGPPTSRVQVKGRGFGSSETVDLALDGTVLSTARTSQGGTFLGALRVPATTLPGAHTILATGETTGLNASGTYLVRTNWTRFEFDNANTGVNPYENVLSTSNVGELSLDWSANLDAFVYGVAVVGGVVYATGQVLGSLDAVVAALDASSGSVIWTRSLPGAGAESTPTVAGGVVYVGSVLGHTLHAYRASDGTPVWTFTAEGGIGVPIVSGHTVYVAVNTAYVDAIDARSGTLRWSTSVGFSNGGGLALSKGVLYLGTNDFKVHALDASTGASLWTATTNGSVVSPPAVAGGVVYVGSNDHDLYAFDASTGAKLWSTPTGAAVTASPAISNGVVYVGSTDHYMYAFDASTGDTLWATPTGAAITGQAPAIANGIVYNGSNDFTIYAFSLATGNVLWSYQTGQIVSQVAVADGVLYVPSFDGNVYSFRLP